MAEAGGEEIRGGLSITGVGSQEQTKARLVQLLEASVRSNAQGRPRQPLIRTQYKISYKFALGDPNADSLHELLGHPSGSSISESHWTQTTDQ